jgi:putative Mg2+ transporter-C (MgtC) family protein
MDAILADMFPTSRIGYPIVFARFVGAIVLGGIIGFEREAKNRPAGLRTHMMVALAAAVFAIISVESIHTAGMDSDNFKPDPLRLVEAVTAGAICLCLGFGHWVIGFAAVIAGISILFVVGFIEDRLDSGGSMHVDDDKAPKGDPPKGK